MKLTLVKKIRQSEDVVSFLFKANEKFSWKAGQYLHYFLPYPNPDSRGKKRYFTISTSPFEGLIGLTSRFASKKGSSFKKELLNLQAGDNIEAENLKGNFVVDDPNKNYVFISGGIGITPFRAILLQLAHDQKPINVTLLYANRNQSFIFKDELEKLREKNSNFKIHYFVDPQRIDEKAIKETIPNLAKPIFFISGPAPMVFAMEDMLGEMGIPKDHIKLDDFPGYTVI